MTVSFQQHQPSWLVRAASNTPRMPVFVDGVQTTSTGTYALRDDSGTTVVSGAIVLDGQTPTYVIGAGSLPASLSLSWMWQEVWTLSIAGVEHVLRRAAWLVKGQPYPGVTFSDLEDMEDTLSKLAVTARDPRLQRKIDTAWGMLMRDLTAMGRRPPRILDGTQLFDWHRFLSLWATFNAAGDAGRQKAADYWALAGAAKNKLVLTLDFNDDGAPDTAEENTPGKPALMLTSSRHGRLTR